MFINFQHGLLGRGAACIHICLANCILFCYCGSSYTSIYNRQGHCIWIDTNLHSQSSTLSYEIKSHDHMRAPSSSSSTRSSHIKPSSRAHTHNTLVWVEMRMKSEFHHRLLYTCYAGIISDVAGKHATCTLIFYLRDTYYRAASSTTAQHLYIHLSSVADHA